MRLVLFEEDYVADSAVLVVTDASNKELQFIVDLTEQHNEDGIGTDIEREFEKINVDCSILCKGTKLDSTTLMDLHEVDKSAVAIGNYLTASVITCKVNTLEDDDDSDNDLDKTECSYFYSCEDGNDNYIDMFGTLEEALEFSNTCERVKEIWIYEDNNGFCGDMVDIVWKRED